jgi:2-polyprenyl-3-methyl-5-hydroxy-6-metoxy-1,4-benzoquinol methylase
MNTPNFLQVLRAKFRSVLLPTDLLIKSIRNQIGTNKVILDIGAGTGYFLKLLLEKGIISYGYGTEILSKYYVENENYTIKSIEAYHTEFDVISLVDVLHHIPDKKSFFEYIFKSTLINQNTIFFIKDISPKNPIYRSWNTLHDIIFNHQIPEYIHADVLSSLMENHGYECTFFEQQKVLLYDHYLVIFKKKLDAKS